MCRVEAYNNLEAVVVCARDVVKRPSKRSALVILLVVISYYKYYTLGSSLVLPWDSPATSEHIRMLCSDSISKCSVKNGDNWNIVP